MKHCKKLLSLALCAGVLAGCGGAPATNGGSDDSNASSGAVGDTVKIGLNFELSGGAADYGKKELNGAKLAIEQFNAREDKPFTVEGVEVDDKGDVAESVTVATRLMTQDGVVAVIGPATSAPSIATYQVATDNSIPVISPSATQVGAMLKDGTPYEFAWRVCFEDSQQGAAMAKYSYEDLGAKTAVIFNQVNDYGQGNAKSYTEEFTSLGGEVLEQIQYNEGDQDFSSYITKIKDKNPEVIYIAGYYNEAGMIVKQLKDAGINCPIVGADGFDSTDFIDKAGKENLNDVYYTTGYTTLDPSEELSEFIKAYTDKYGEEPGMFAALAYDATNMLLSSLETSGATGAELNNAIKSIKFDGITGSFSFDESTHTPNKDIIVVELVDGVQSNATVVSAD